MPQKNQAVMDFLLSRRSRPPKTLVAPGPGREELMELLTAAGRSPDHGKLEPWRFVVIEGAAFARMERLAVERGAALGTEERLIEKVRQQYEQGVLAVAVIESPKESDKVPALEQTYSTGAVCLALVNAALASGWGASWLTGWAVHDPVFTAEALGVAPHERVAGVVHIGTETVMPPERPRPDIAAITTWMTE